MSAFTESALIKKLVDLNSSQQSIQTLSLWLIHHRKHHSHITKSWYNEMRKAQKSKKLTFMYLANDVIQNSKKKGPEYGKEFQKVLPKAFLHIGETCAQSDNKTISSLDRILKIWEDRMVYDSKVVQGFREALHKSDESHSPKTEPPEKRKREDDDAKRHKIVKLDGFSRERVKSETVEVNGRMETHVILSPQATAGDPPEPEELIRALIDLENSASSDAVVREQIANLPPEVSEVAMLSKLEDKEQAAKLVIQVNEAAKILNEYNARLSAEMEDRKRLTTMLKDFQAEQRDLLAQAEQRIQEYNAKLNKVKDVQREIRSHLQNLPDLTQLPDVTGGLAPLPSAGDLFNIH
ncbi:Regulation of nuclear pre-mRNA domain-containing protein 1B [Pseudolycoriella hygida]|uniref:Regulation of nuclear pre-mRNA domain-containing protein 1B n=1 Tax=Pseudolycoriella hygida TaxID=35572 RepID=A0A9Q0RU31_9DIPT|nr:Regulation of nuclear pre-mRNA domain-containing protein 1B [Pseudolycoriella hygida]